MSEPTTSRRKNAREEYRYLTDAEAVAADVELVMRTLRGVVGRLVPDHDAEAAGRVELEQADIMPATLAMLGRVKGAMCMARIAHGLAVKDITPGTGWSTDTLRQFELREADAMVSSLVRYATGLRRAGVPGHLEVRWVTEEQPPRRARRRREVPRGGA